ncbi:MAG TPA: hypothetical protein DD624_08185 [Alphaproteobacteria bacterium]|nr:hypothetical protein [Alphaproteobacteria bacterium]
MTPSAFAIEKKQADARKAFYAVAVLAALSFSVAAAGVYWSFFNSPAPAVSFDLERVKTTELINPQPPEQKAAEPVETPAETAELIQQIEEHKKSVDATAESLKKKVESSAPAPAPESAEVAGLHREQAAAAEQKIAEIAALAQERDVKQRQKEISAAAEAHEESAKNEFSAYAPAVAEPPKKKAKYTIPTLIKKSDLKNALTKPSAGFYLHENGERLPLPELVHTTLVESLPNFGLIKQKDVKGVLPLQVIQPLADLRKDGLPVKAGNGLTPAKAYAASVSEKPAVPYISVLLSGLGRRKNVTESAVASMPAAVSMSFSPYAPRLKEYIESARKAGHETLLDMPMQHGTFPETDPGPLGLVVGLPEHENHKRLRKVLGTNAAFIGLAAQRNQNFSYYAAAEMKKFVEEIDSRGLIMIAGSDESDMPAFEKTVRPDVYIADDLYRAAIKARLEKALKQAQKDGRAFVRIEAYPVTMVALLEFMKSLAPTEENPEPKVVFAPVSYYAQQTAEAEK